MFFENDSVSFNLLDVLELKQKNVNMQNTKRNFHALSYRRRAATLLKTENEVFHLTDHTVSFVPGGLDYNRSSKVDDLIVVHFELTNCDARGIEFFKTKDPEAMEGLFEEILDLWNRKETAYQYRCSGIFNEILARCYTENYKKSGDDSKIRKSVEYLLMHYRDSDCTIDKIAAQSFISQVYFRKMFKAEYGISPQKYIVHLRIQCAKELISVGYHSLQEIAFLSGYRDYKYFSSEFRKHVGISPSKYRYNYEK